MIRRGIEASLRDAMADTPVVLVHGARQTGKSTLAKTYAQSVDGATYLTLDDATVLAAAVGDPAGFLSQFTGPVVLDEVQRAPGLFLAIKLLVDRDRRPGRFLLTGSADVLLVPALSDSLAGRMEILTLWPFAGVELSGDLWSFVDMLFSDNPLPKAAALEPRPLLLQRIACGGFPEALARTAARRREAWFGSYITTILQRDVREVSNIENLTMLPRLLALLAARSCGLLNQAELSRALGMPLSTLRRYLTLLEMTFLLRQTPAWSANLGKRLIKSPKATLCDTGLMSFLLGIDASQGIPDHLTGPLVENHAVMELTKHLGWSATRAALYHFRDQTGQEVDILLEDAMGRLVGIEVKAATGVSKEDFRHLQLLRKQTGPRFHRGVVLHTGTETVAFDGQLSAFPLGALTPAPRSGTDSRR